MDNTIRDSTMGWESMALHHFKQSAVRIYLPSVSLRGYDHRLPTDALKTISFGKTTRRCCCMLKMPASTPLACKVSTPSRTWTASDTEVKIAQVCFIGRSREQIRLICQAVEMKVAARICSGFCSLHLHVHHGMACAVQVGASSQIYICKWCDVKSFVVRVKSVASGIRTYGDSHCAMRSLRKVPHAYSNVFIAYGVFLLSLVLSILTPTLRMVVYFPIFRVEILH